jgi:hypothetical protein
MPESLVVAGVEVAGLWGHLATPVRFRGSLVIEPLRLEVRDTQGRLETNYALLTDATWAGGELGLHWERGAARVRGGEALAPAWARIVASACALPEVARGLRSLGTRRGGKADLQRRFFGPLLVGRRRLEEPDSMEWRLAHFDARVVRRQIDEALAGIARERHPASPPHRRALGAALDEAVEELAVQLELLDRAADAARMGAEGRRFVAWRAWTTQLRAVFVEADRAWPRILAALDER